jgi:hypothetical protein
MNTPINDVKAASRHHQTDAQLAERLGNLVASAKRRRLSIYFLDRMTDQRATVISQ